MNCFIGMEKWAIIYPTSWHLTLRAHKPTPNSRLGKVSGSSIFSTKMKDLLTYAPDWDEAERAESLRHSSGFYQYFFPIRLGFSDHIRIPPGDTDSLLGALKFLWNELMNWNHGAKEEVLSSVTWLSSDRRRQVTKKRLDFCFILRDGPQICIIPSSSFPYRFAYLILPLLFYSDEIPDASNKNTGGLRVMA